jgi:universal stress protein A
MPVYQHILTAVDFGDQSEKVLQHALALAHLCEAELSVLHVVNFNLPSDTDYMIPLEEDLESRLTGQAEHQLHELLGRAAHPGGVRAIIASGRPKIEIVHVAEREKADLVVIGAHGRHGLAGMFGSTANHVLTRAACHVLVVR